MTIIAQIFGEENRHKTISAVLCTALILRVFVSFTVGSELRWYDEQNYHSIGVSILEGNGFHSSYNPYSTTHWAPLQGYYLAAVYAVFGDSPHMARIIQDLLAVLCCFLIYRIGTRMFDHAVGVVASLIFAFHPLFVYSANTLYAVSNFTLLAVLIFMFSQRSAEPESKMSPFLAGLFLGLAMLSKPVAIFLIPAIPMALLLSRKLRFSQVVLRSIIVFGVSALVLVPWTFHNYQKYGTIYFITQEGAHSLAAANNQQLAMGDRGSIAIPDEVKERVENLSEDDRNEVYMDEAVGFILSHPLQFIRMYTYKFTTFWRLYPSTISKNQDTSKRNIVISAVFYALLLPIALLGMFYTRKEWRRLFLLHGFIFGFALGYSLFIPSIRYRMPIEPFVILFAAFALLQLTQRLFPAQFQLKADSGL